ncbi:Kelch-like protein 5 [Hordeum vulgare]|nr:Kelch-like protein 5 [Hordeum vulgare]
MLSEIQFPPSYGEDSQPPMEHMPNDSEVFEVPLMVPPFMPCFFLGSPKDAAFLNTPIHNYHKMQQIFSFRVATGKHSMRSSQSDGEHVLVLDKTRKRAIFTDEELNVLSSMTEVVKEVATTIRESKSVDVHPQLYGAVMERIRLSLEALMVSLSHLMDNRAQGVGFVTMGLAHMVIWLRTSLGKHYY